MIRKLRLGNSCGGGGLAIVYKEDQLGALTLLIVNYITNLA